MNVRDAIATGIVGAVSTGALAGTIYENRFDGVSTSTPSYVAPGVITTGIQNPGPTSAVGSFAGTSSHFVNKMFLSSTSSSSEHTLTFLNLPVHTKVSVGFVLAMMEKWNDWAPAFSANDTRFQIAVGTSAGTAATVFDHVFDNDDVGLGYTANRISWGTQHLLGPAPDSAYNMFGVSALQNIPHAAPTLFIRWRVINQGGSALGWGMDNLNVLIDNPQAIPLPNAAGMGLAGLGLVAMRRRRR